MQFCLLDEQGSERAKQNGCSYHGDREKLQVKAKFMYS